MLFINRAPERTWSCVCRSGLASSCDERVRVCGRVCMCMLGARACSICSLCLPLFFLQICLYYILWWKWERIGCAWKSDCPIFNSQNILRHENDVELIIIMFDLARGEVRTCARYIFGEREYICICLTTIDFFSVLIYSYTNSNSGKGGTGLPKPNDKPCLVVSVVGVTKREEPAAYMTRRVLDPGNCPREFTQSRSRQLVEIFHHAALKLALHWLASRSRSGGRHEPSDWPMVLDHSQSQRACRNRLRPTLSREDNIHE